MTADHEPSRPHSDDLSEYDIEKAANAKTSSVETETDEGPVAITCPVCQLVNRPGELACSRCGTILAQGGTTRKFNATDEPQQPASWPTGEVILTEQEPIVLIIEDEQVHVPIAEVITVGRNSDIPDDSMPDVDLSAFGAGDKGVSRKHIKIKRKDILIYVAYLGSTNGNLLNGRRLIPNAERLLRHGVELHLGRLKVKVKF